jgi:hypothetical protein
VPGIPAFAVFGDTYKDEGLRKMRLRDYPLMSYRGVCNWPPVWVGIAEEKRRPRSETASLMKSVLENFIGREQIALAHHTRSHYLGTLLFDDRAFCLQIYQVLTNNCGKSIYQIGAIDLNYTL